MSRRWLVTYHSSQYPSHWKISAALLLVRPPNAANALELIHALIASSGIGVLVVDSLAIFQSLPRDAQLLGQA